MEDSNDFSKMKVADLKKELKSRGLPSTGDKAMLVARLTAAMSQISQDDQDVTLDSDEIDSDGVLDEDDNDKGQSDILDSLNEELALADNTPPAPAAPVAPEPAPAESKPPHRTLKRKLTMDASKKNDNNSAESKDTAGKKIVLNRATSLTPSNPSAVEEKTQLSTEDKKETNVSNPIITIISNNNKVRITADIGDKSKLEIRAKRFGLPLKITDEQRKEARKNRFSQNASSVLSTNVAPSSLADNLDKLKKRAERFGQSVSKIMTDIENKERLEKRKAKFGTDK